MPSGKTSFTNIKDKKVMIYKETKTKNDLGEMISIWNPISETKLWASYRSLSGSQIFEAAAVGYKADAMFIINWRNDIEPNMIVVYRGKAWIIHRVDDLEGYKSDLKLTCETKSGTNANLLRAYPGIVL